MKKIKISGCANCPYLSIYFYNSENGEPHVSYGTCNHPSFNKSLPGMPLGAANFVAFGCQTIDEDYSGTEPTAYGVPDDTPKWCPLPIDHEPEI